MVTAIKGQTVKLYTMTKTGVDDFNQPVYSEASVDVDNVLIEPADNSAIVDEMQISGKHLSYVLHIPKGDTHTWKDTKVEFYGAVWRTFGDCLIYDEALTPLDWNKKVKVERYD